MEAEFSCGSTDVAANLSKVTTAPEGSQELTSEGGSVSVTRITSRPAPARAARPRAMAAFIAAAVSTTTRGSPEGTSSAKATDTDQVRRGPPASFHGPDRPQD